MTPLPTERLMDPVFPTIYFIIDGFIAYVNARSRKIFISWFYACPFVRIPSPAALIALQSTEK